MSSQSEEIGELATALAEAQPLIGGALKSSQADSGNRARKYADLGSVWDAIREPLKDHGLSVVQTMVDPGPGTQEAVVRTVLLHKSGQWIGGEIRMPFSPPPGSNAAQGAGSAITYARRYALAALLGVCPEDDDGAGAGAPVDQRQERKDPPRKPQQTEQVRSILVDLKNLSLIEEFSNLADEVKKLGLSDPEKAQLRGPFSKRKHELEQERDAMDGGGPDEPPY